MKIHEGKCSGQPCTRTHGYKCRSCQIYFKQHLVDIGLAQIAAHPTYPYCSVTCAAIAKRADKGYHMFEHRVELGLAEGTATREFPDPTAHQDFNNLMEKTKEL